MWGGLRELLVLGCAAQQQTLWRLDLPVVTGIPDTGWDGAQQLQIVRFIS